MTLTSVQFAQVRGSKERVITCAGRSSNPAEENDGDRSSFTLELGDCTVLRGNACLDLLVIIGTLPKDSVPPQASNGNASGC